MNYFLFSKKRLMQRLLHAQIIYSRLSVPVHYLIR
jgi:hypothetical protein